MKIVIEFSQIADAGMYDLVVFDNEITEILRLHLGLGQPLESAFREAELLATAIDCEFFNKTTETVCRIPISKQIKV